MKNKRISKESIKTQMYKPRGAYYFNKIDFQTYELTFYLQKDNACIEPLYGKFDIKRKFNPYSGITVYTIKTI